MSILKIFNDGYSALYKFREDCETLQNLRIPFKSSVTQMTITIGNVVIHYETTYNMDKFKGMEYSDIIFDECLSITKEDRDLLLSRKRGIK